MGNIIRRRTGTDEYHLSGRSANDRLVVLLLGETGSGKSTLINYITSYCKGGSATSPRIAIPNEFYEATEACANSEYGIGDRIQSRTTKCNSYDFEVDGCHFRFIDSPGLSNTNGMEEDAAHLREIMQTAENAGVVSVIVVVLNGTITRNTDNVRKALIRLGGSWPDVNAAENVIVVFTHCTSSSFNYNLDTLHPWIPKAENFFFVNNTVLSQDPQRWCQAPYTQQGMDEEWEQSMRAIGKLLDRVGLLQTKRVSMSDDEEEEQGKEEGENEEENEDDDQNGSRRRRSRLRRRTREQLPK
ncbi:uncharacterized protein LOC129601576 [Paramacrobiotus metropolitanus]|uniref:uncharacterized protein LOC129601576 n=1 Tax=Paramacrobiotus metropolitanus TaxID=2943436 RepID=UPI0024457536|nr:uncharacterized protein LOC129601576 [Paramacrobiotus metropolitanus]